MNIPDFSVPSEECFLTVDKNGTQIREGDTLTSHLIAVHGTNPTKREYKVIKWEDKLVAPVKPSHLLSFFVQAHCEVTKRSNILKESTNKLEWIKKRVPLDDLQEEYVGFILNEQQRMITLLSAHIYAASGCLAINDVEQAKYFLEAGRNDIEGKPQKHDT